MNCKQCGHQYCDNCTKVTLTTARIGDLAFVAGVSLDNECLIFAPAGDFTSPELIGVDTETVTISTGGVQGHEIRADVKVSAEPCNEIEVKPDGFYSCKDFYVAESLNDTVGAPFKSFEYGENTAPYVEEPAEGSWLIRNPSSCKSLKMQISGDIPVVLNNGHDAITTTWDRSFILLEVDVGTGPAIIAAKQSSRQITTNEGENVKDWNVVKCFTIEPGVTLNIPWKLTFINDQGNSAGGSFWLPTLAVWGHTV